MPFSFDEMKARKAVRVAWNLNGATVAQLGDLARESKVDVQDLVQQMLDYVLAEGKPKRGRPRAS